MASFIQKRKIREKKGGNYNSVSSSFLFLLFQFKNGKIIILNAYWKHGKKIK